MFDEPQEDPAARLLDPAARAKEKAEEFCVHAELAAVFEGRRKFEAELHTRLDYSCARDIQVRLAKLERAKTAGIPVLPESVIAEAAALLTHFKSLGLSTNDYHLHRRPGELMIVRWLEGEQVESFYERMQAHFDVAMNDYREEERQAQGWKQDPATQKYLTALDAVNLRMADRYLRDIIRKHNVSALSTASTDELNIQYLAEYVMGVSVAELVGPTSAPPEQPTEHDLAWFFKLFSLRGISEEVERMCFFAYLQKTEDAFDTD